MKRGLYVPFFLILYLGLMLSIKMPKNTFAESEPTPFPAKWYGPPTWYGSGFCRCNERYVEYAEEGVCSDDPIYNVVPEDCPGNNYERFEKTCKQGACTENDVCWDLRNDQFVKCGSCPNGFGYDPSSSYILERNGCRWEGSDMYDQCSTIIECVPSPDSEVDCIFDDSIQ